MTVKEAISSLWKHCPDESSELGEAIQKAIDGMLVLEIIRDWANGICKSSLGYGKAKNDVLALLKNLPEGYDEQAVQCHPDREVWGV